MWPIPTFVCNYKIQKNEHKVDWPENCTILPNLGIIVEKFALMHYPHLQHVWFPERSPPRNPKVVLYYFSTSHYMTVV